MKKIDANELYQNLSGFLRANGVELKDGAYTERIRNGCNALTDVINTTQQTVVRARATVDRNLDRLRQTIHDATAPGETGGPGPNPSAHTKSTSSSSSSRSRRPARPSPKASAKSAQSKRRK